MAEPNASTHTPVELLAQILRVTEEKIIPMTQVSVKSGSKFFGAAILTREGLTPHTVATNNDRVSPLLHGEINCIQTFFESPAETRPSTRDCIFFATHEPCSLCLSGITWAGFNEFYYLFTYEDSRDVFATPYGIDILEEVFRVPTPSDTPESLATRPLYNHRNRFFTGRSLAELVAEIEDPEEKRKWVHEIERVKGLYNALSDTYQESKQAGVKTSSVFR